MATNLKNSDYPQNTPSEITYVLVCKEDLRDWTSCPWRGSPVTLRQAVFLAEQYDCNISLTTASNDVVFLVGQGQVERFLSDDDIVLGRDHLNWSTAEELKPGFFAAEKRYRDGLRRQVEFACKYWSVLSWFKSDGVWFWSDHNVQVHSDDLVAALEFEVGFCEGLYSALDARG